MFTPSLANHLGQVAGALDIEDHLGTRVARQHIGGKVHQQVVRVNHTPTGRHDAQAVTVAVEGKADVGTALLDVVDQILQVFRLAGVGVMVGEAAIDLVKQWCGGDPKP